MTNDSKICSIQPTGLSFFLNMSLRLVDFSSHALFCSSRCNGVNGAVGQVAVVPVVNEHDGFLEILSRSHKNLDACFKDGVFHPAQLCSGIVSHFRTTLAMYLMRGKSGHLQYFSEFTEEKK